LAIKRARILSFLPFRNYENEKQFQAQSISIITGSRPRKNRHIPQLTQKYNSNRNLRKLVRYSGVLGVEGPHQSILNLVVKLYCGDDTVGEVLRQNSSMPE
ncbi:hypothetical protein ZWY2020_012303, partial [Hordeum vulgare]